MGKELVTMYGDPSELAAQTSCVVDKAEIADNENNLSIPRQRGPSSQKNRLM